MKTVALKLVEKIIDKAMQNCFSLDSQVVTSFDKTVCLRDLKIGDQIKTLDKSGNEIFTPVIAMIHRN